MKRVWHLVRKDFAIFMTDPIAIGLSFVVPLVMIVVFGFVFSGSGSESLNELQILCVNEDSGPAGAKLLSDLDKTSELSIKYHGKRDTTNVDSARARELVAKGAFSVALILPKDFSDGIRNGELRAYQLEDPRDPVSAGVLNGLLQKAAFESFPYLMPSAMMGGMMSDSNAMNDDIRGVVEKHVGFSFPKDRPMFSMMSDEVLFGTDTSKSSGGINAGAAFEKVNQIKREEVVGQKVVNPGVAQSTAGTAVMFMLFGVGAITASLLREMRSGTATRLLLSGASAGELLLAKSFYSVAFGTFQLCVMMVYGWLIFDLQIFDHVPALLLMIVITSLAMSGVGLILSALAQTEEQAGGYQVVLILSMSAIGGAMFPSFMLPSFIKTIAGVTPVHWAMQGFTDIFWRSEGITGIMLECGILLAMSALMIGISILIFRRRLATELG